MVRGATLMQTHADPGADQHLRNGTRSNAGIPMISCCHIGMTTTKLHL